MFYPTETAKVTMVKESREREREKMSVNLLF
jgi:hypothetical protein